MNKSEKSYDNDSNHLENFEENNKSENNNNDNTQD